MRTLVFLSFVTGCATGPASLEVSPATQTVHTTESVALPAVTGLDAKGAPMELTEQPTWTVTPDSVAKLSADGHSLELIGDGTATATAKIGEVTATFTLEVSLPDTLTLAPMPATQVGLSTPLVATVSADGTPLAEHEPIVFAVSDPALATVEGDLLRATAPGELDVTATSGSLSTTAHVTILPAAEAPVADVE